MEGRYSTENPTLALGTRFTGVDGADTMAISDVPVKARLWIVPRDEPVYTTVKLTKARCPTLLALSESAVPEEMLCEAPP